MIERYEENLHYPMMSSWYEARKWLPLPKDILPQIGFIVPDIAAGFLYQTDSRLGYLENYISNPLSDPRVRSQALDDITRALTQVSDDLGLKLVLAWTALPVIAERACRFGFEVKRNDQILLARIN